jgi:hypothetical protein
MFLDGMSEWLNLNLNYRNVILFFHLESLQSADF